MINFVHLDRLIVLGFIVSVIWIFLLPLVSVSTGELKPRQLYVDEHALLVNGVVQHNHHVHEYKSISNSYLDYINCRDEIHDFQSLICHDMNEINSTILIYNSNLQARSQEAIIILIPFISVIDSSMINNLLSKVMNTLSITKWLSKQVIFILVRFDQKSSHQIRKKWIQSSLNALLDSQFHKFDPVIIRHAFVLDFLASGVQRMHTNSIMEYTDCISQYNSISTWDHIELNVMSDNGLLPNLDLVSSLLSLYPNTVTIPSSSFTLPSFLQNIMDRYFIEYVSRLFGLLKFSFYPYLSLDTDMLHSIYLNQGIHSISLTPINSHLQTLVQDLFSSKSISGNVIMHNEVDRSKFNFNQCSDKKIKYMDSDISEDLLVEMLMSLIHITSNLHEELHHSQAVYLLMGNRHFVVSCYTLSLFFSFLNLVYLFIYLFKSMAEIACIGCLAILPLMYYLVQSVSKLDIFNSDEISKFLNTIVLVLSATFLIPFSKGILKFLSKFLVGSLDFIPSSILDEYFNISCCIAIKVTLLSLLLLFKPKKSGNYDSKGTDKNKVSNDKISTHNSVNTLNYTHGHQLMAILLVILIQTYLYMINFFVGYVLNIFSFAVLYHVVV